MHAFLCAAAGLTVSLGAVSAANASVRTAERIDVGAVQFELMEGLTGYTSARNWTNVRTVAPGETFNAATLGQNTAGAFFMDDFPDDFSFFGGVQDAGAHLFTGSATRGTGNQSGNVVTVAHYTLDSSDYLPAGLDPQGNGDTLSQLRFDVGGFAAGADSITYPGFSAADVVQTEIVLFIDGGAVFSTVLAPTNVDFSTGLAAVSVINGAVGAGVDEMQIVFTLNVPTPGAASVFGLAGLAAVRRRRR